MDEMDCMDEMDDGGGKRRCMQRLYAALLLLALVPGSALAAITHVKVIAQTTASSGNTISFTLQATNANDAIVMFFGCNASGGTPSAVSVAATGWSFTALSPITGNTTNGFGASFGAIAPNTSGVTATVTWTVTGSTCNGFQNALADEFTGNDTTGGTTTFDAHGQNTGGSGCSLSVTPANANDAVWFACNDSVTAVGSGWTKGADDASQDVAEYKILSGGSGVAQNASYTSASQMVITGITIKPSGGGSTPKGFPTVQ